MSNLVKDIRGQYFSQYKDKRDKCVSGRPICSDLMKYTEDMIGWERKETEIVRTNRHQYLVSPRMSISKLCTRLSIYEMFSLSNVLEMYCRSWRQTDVQSKQVILFNVTREGHDMRGRLLENVTYVLSLSVRLTNCGTSSSSSNKALLSTISLVSFFSLILISIDFSDFFAFFFFFRISNSSKLWCGHVHWKRHSLSLLDLLQNSDGMLLMLSRLYHFTSSLQIVLQLRLTRYRTTCFRRSLTFASSVENVLDNLVWGSSMWNDFVIRNWRPTIVNIPS